MIQHGMTDAFSLDLLNAYVKNVYRIALYGAEAELNRLTPAYTTKGEVIGAPGYEAGGKVLEGAQVKLYDAIAVMGFNSPVVWPKSTITARAALIYDFTRQNRAVAVIDLGPSPTGDPRGWSSTNGNFVVTIPELNAVDALIRIGGV